jgi:hypothetical protein
MQINNEEITADKILELNNEEVKKQVGYRRIRNAVHPERADTDTEYFCDRFSEYLADKHKAELSVKHDIQEKLEEMVYD